MLRNKDEKSEISTGQQTRGFLYYNKTLIYLFGYINMNSISQKGDEVT